LSSSVSVTSVGAGGVSGDAGGAGAELVHAAGTALHGLDTASRVRAEAGAGGASAVGGLVGGAVVPARAKRSLRDRIEEYLARLTSRSNFWHRVASLVWLPYAFRSGIRIKKVDGSTFSAVLPFRRFNRNWYNAMAGAALLANAEIAGGMYIYGRCGGDYTVVCKTLNYRFLRPCFGPAIYRMTPKADLDALLATGREFNFEIEIDVVQQLPTRGLGKDVRVGRCTAVFHITPKALHAARAARREAQALGVPGSVRAPTGPARGGSEAERPGA
jgi:hypothetical protein